MGITFSNCFYKEKTWFKNKGIFPEMQKQTLFELFLCGPDEFCWGGISIDVSNWEFILLRL